jgi:CRP-like cAMP-binding protein
VHSFFVLLHGHVRASKTTPAGQQVVVRYVTPGEIFGVAPAIGLTKYPATATAVDDSVALAWPSAAWPRLVARHPALATNTLQTVGSRLQGTHTRVVEMSTQRVERRVAHACCGSPGRPGGRWRQGVEIDFDQPAGYRRDDRHHAAYREPHVERLGEPGPDRAAASASCCAITSAVHAGQQDGSES